ncbi:acidic fibroblast growth factor intracellular-binding protein [Tribolium castaneum]|uniref:Acidic fibroblast growth factor intracellular-binding protein-like Protein n=1 Tax=Tribolium castaneum TaxID=7070 RepID=D6WYT7_TRICA|nr:PREDICTED: acidic fibroblast growth factor intracellular-binding protein [Tribolium castaneum]EFA08394.1 Acidic fibroblast growth factor intracellular-binding protein-like Protein [Tribolium castaneum]|eukprot:XP_970066.1 PREDICTED: acidic fibroblast growth factor intracellular-binding protein [Tribolium castaneum]
MGTEIDVFISNYTLVDPEIYQLWVEGHTASEAVSILNQRGLGQVTGASLELIASDVLDHYRTYSLLEKLLSNPNKLQEQLAFQIEPQTRQLLIEKYYDFDDVVVRELIGKKLSSKHRKDLDEVAEKTRVPLKSCRRQFDNVKRIYKMVEDMPGPVVQNIQNHFYLSEPLAKKYACIVFLACIRFETKRKLNHITFTCWKRCTEAIMDNWTNKLAGVDNFDTELDKDFFTELKDIKIMFEKEREHKQLVCVSLKATLLHKSYTDLDANFKNYNRALLQPASNMHRPRDVKNMFLELNSLSDSLKQANWSGQELEIFLNGYTQCGLEIDVIRDSAPMKILWEKYMKVISECLLAMY